MIWFAVLLLYLVGCYCASAVLRGLRSGPDGEVLLVMLWPVIVLTLLVLGLIDLIEAGWTKITK